MNRMFATYRAYRYGWLRCSAGPASLASATDLCRLFEQAGIQARVGLWDEGRRVPRPPPPDADPRGSARPERLPNPLTPLRLAAAGRTLGSRHMARKSKRSAATARLLGDVGVPAPLRGAPVLDERPAVKMVPPPGGWERPWHAAWLACYRRTHNVALACRETDRNRAWVYESLQKHPRFAAAKEALDQEMLDYAEATYVHLALQGWLEPVYHQGVLAGYKRRFDLRALERVLKNGGRLKDEAPQDVAAEAALAAAQQAERISEALEQMVGTVPMQGPAPDDAVEVEAEVVDSTPPADGD